MFMNTWMDEAAKWHREQARMYKEISEDEPRISQILRERASEVSEFHAGSAAALENKAANHRKKNIE